MPKPRRELTESPAHGKLNDRTDSGVVRRDEIVAILKRLGLLKADLMGK